MHSESFLLVSLIDFLLVRRETCTLPSLFACYCHPSFADLAQVAMTAAAYPLVIANEISLCMHAIDIGPVPHASKGTDYNWQTANLTSFILSCGLKQIRPDRCCSLIVGAFGQQDALLYNRTGSSLGQVRSYS
jgi:hypothetical protein